MVDKIKTYVINLPNSGLRKSHMENQLKVFPELNIEFWRATHGKMISQEEKNKIYNQAETIVKLGRPLSSGEIGIAHSQLSIYKDIIANNTSTSLILEDDVQISPYLSDCIPYLQAEMEGSSPKIILLTPIFSYLNWSKKKLIQSQDRYIVKPFGDYCWAAGYLINYSAAKILADKLFPIHTVADDWKFFSKAFNIKIYALDHYLISFAKVGGQWNSIIGNEDRFIIEKEKRKKPKYILILKTIYLKIKKIAYNFINFIRGVKMNKQLMWENSYGIKVPKF